MELSKVGLRINEIFKSYRYGNLSARKGVRAIINVLNSIDPKFDTAYDNLYVAELIKKGIRYMLRMEAPSKETYNFLEENIVDDTLEPNARYYLLKILSQYYPKKVLGLQNYLLQYVKGYFPENLKFEGKEIVLANLQDFLFKTHTILSNYADFSYNPNYRGLTSDYILIVKTKHDTYNNEKFVANYPYNSRYEWSIRRNNNSVYLIDDKYKIGIRELLFAVKLFKNHTTPFDDSSLIISFSNDTDMPIKLSYIGDSGIIICIFPEI